MGLYLQKGIVFIIGIFIVVYIFIKKKVIILYILILLFGFSYIKVIDYDYNKKLSYINEEITLKAIIITNFEDKEYRYDYKIKVIGDSSNKLNNSNFIISINKNKLTKGIPEFGDIIEIKGEFQKANEARNYKGFDYSQYLKSKKIYGTIKVSNYKILQKDRANFLNKVIDITQNSIKRKMTDILNTEEAALCVGILIGNREDISEETENNFKKSNLTHMLAVSGSHITYIITALATILGKTSKKFYKIFTIIFLIFFMALTGFTASVLRACIMGILVLIASLLHRKPDTINNLGISSLIILLINPYIITDMGFLLSYGGTIGIVVLGDRITNFMYTVINKNNLLDRNLLVKSSVKRVFIKVLKYIINSFAITISANIIIIPIMAYSFSTLSLTFWVSNILAAPIMEIVTISGFIVYFISLVISPLANFLGIFLNILLFILLKIAEISSKIPGANIYIKTPYLCQCLVYYFVIIAMYNKDILKSCVLKCMEYFKIRYKKIIAIIVIIILIVTGIKIVPQELKIYFIDVGQGDSTLIQTPTNKKILIDGGGSEFGSFDVGESILLPYLLDRRITTLDYIIISHFDSDHVGGLFAILENIKVKNIIISKQGENSTNFKKLVSIINHKKINIRLVKRGDFIKIDRYSYFEILFPENKLIEDNIINNNSIVAKFNSLGFNMLFTGDIEEIAEKRLCELYNNTNKLSAMVLKVAHHGSKTSSTTEFLELVRPQVAFIGVGENNKFGHPNDEVLERIEKIRCQNL